MTHKHQKKCELCEGITTYNTIGNNEYYLCEKAGKGCAYAETINMKYTK